MYGSGARHPRGPYLGGDRMNLGDIACACALFWVEFRMPEVGWREGHPNLRAWAEALESRAAFQATRPKTSRRTGGRQRPAAAAARFVQRMMPPPRHSSPR